MPAGIHVVSPFCDLALSLDHLGPAADSDPWLNRIALIQLAACYLHDADPGQALVSPSRADLSGLPPAFIDVGSAETFRDEDVAYATRIWQAGGRAELHVWPGAFHGFTGIVPDAAVSKAATAAQQTWLRRMLAG